jgi:DNA-binding NarL/FixJ family response regulator
VEIVGAAGDGPQGLAVARELRPDVVLLDPRVAGVDDVELIGRLRQEVPQARVLLLVGDQETAEIYRALRAGAKGYVSRNANLGGVTKAIRDVHAGEVCVEPRLIAEILWGGAEAAPAAAALAPSADALTERERQILRLLASGGTNRHIARSLSISEKTVKTHLNNIFRKLNVTRRLQAVLYAMRAGLRAP